MIPTPEDPAPADDERALRTLTFLRGDQPAPRPHIDWLRCAERLDDADCDTLIAACHEFPLSPPIVVGEDRLPGHRQADTRMVLPNPKTRWIFDLLGGVAAQATKGDFGLTLTGITRPPQYCEYRPDWGHFAWHNDYSHGLPDAPRKLTIIIQLSRPEDYEGGLLQVFGVEVEDLPRERGTILVFPSFLFHRVTPVTRGLRRAMVAWIAGPRIS